MTVCGVKSFPNSVLFKMSAFCMTYEGPYEQEHRRLVTEFNNLRIESLSSPASEQIQKNRLASLFD